MPTRCRVALAAALITCSTGGLVAQERTEQEVIELIVRDGPQARAIRAAGDVVAAEQAARLALPNTIASYTREGAGFTEFAVVEQSFPAFGLRGALQRAGVAAREAAAAERDARLWQLRGAARDAIARIRGATLRIQAAESLVRLIEGLVAVLRTRELEGEGSRFERVRTEQELAEAQQQLVAAAVERASARGALAALLPPGTTVPSFATDADRASALDNLESLVARAIGNRAELRALAAAADRFSLEGEAARRATRPAPTFTAGLKRADEGAATRAGAIVGFGMTVPLFNRGALDAARWHAERTRVELERALLEADIRAQVALAAESMALRRQNRTAVEASVTSAEELIAIADVAYREGEIGILQLLDAYRTVARARDRAIEAQLNVRLAEIALERAVGVTLWP